MRLPTTPSGDEFDLVVIGMGSAGISATEVAARELGLRVAAIDEGRFGGDCLWTGCVPSKALIASARVAHTVRQAHRFGVETAEPTVDLEAVWQRIDDVRRQVSTTDDDPDRFRAMGVDVIVGTAVVTGPREVTVGGRTLRTRFTLVCTGSRPLIPPIEGIGDIDVLSSENLFDIRRPPDSLVIAGGGPIACEMAQALNRLGVQITMVQRGDRLLPKDLPSHAELLADVLRREGVDIRLRTSATAVRASGEGVAVSTDTGDAITGGGLLVATGRLPNAHGLGLERLGIEIDARGIRVDDHNRTSVRTVYAVGDVTGGALFTHAAGHDASLAVRDMFLPGRGTPPSLVPWTTFTDPEVAHVGSTEAEAIDQHGRRKVTVVRRELAHNDRARADGETTGEIVVVTVRGKIVGAHAICPHAGELIHELTLAIHTGMKLSDLAQMMHVYPTYSSTVGRLAGDHALVLAHRLRAVAKLGRVFG